MPGLPNDDLGLKWSGVAVVENDESIAGLRIARHIGAEVTSVAHNRDERRVVGHHRKIVR